MCSALSSSSFSAFWRDYAARHNLTLREAGMDHGGLRGRNVTELIDAETCVVALPALSHARALRLPLAEIGAVCRGQNVFFVVDATSCAGVLRLQADLAGIDALVVAAEKNALGLHGTGFTCIAGSAAEGSAGARKWLRSRPHHENEWPEVHAGESDPVMLSVANAAMGVLLDCGLKNIEMHALCLAEQLRTALEELGMTVDRPQRPEHSGPVAVVGAVNDSGDGALPDAALRALAVELTAGRVRFGVCAGQLQFGFHLYNGVRDVMDVRRIAAQFLRG